MNNSPDKDGGGRVDPYATSSRLIIKNLPKHMTEERLKEHFRQLKDETVVVTDARIMRKGNKSRQFGFIGFKSEKHAQKALKYFQNTYIDTSKIELDFAKRQGDESLPRAWSRHTLGSSAYALTHKKTKRELKAQSKSDVEEKKRKFREFLRVMGVNKEEVGGSTTWNDSFQSYMDGKEKLRAPPKRQKKEEVAEAAERTAEPKDTEQADAEAKAAAEVEQSGEKAEQKRLYVMNLSYEVTYDELMELFSKYGEVDRIEIPLRKGGRG